MSDMPRDGSGRSIPVLLHGLATQKLAFNLTVGASQVLPTGTSSVRLLAQDADAWVLIDPTSTSFLGATSPAWFLKSGIPEYFGVKGLSKVMVVGDATSGTLHIAPGA